MGRIESRARREYFYPIYHQQPDWEKYSWPETSNYIHTRDLQLVNGLLPIIDALLKQNNKQQDKPLVIASIQMGMIPYHIRAHYPKDVYFLDMRGLSTRHVSECESFKDAQRIWTGIFVSYEEFFNAYHQGDCDLPQVDIVYELLNRSKVDVEKRLLALENNHYKMVYRQQGIIVGLNNRKSMDTPFVIAVREELFDQLPKSLQATKVTLTNLAQKQ